ncbi:hypothetical protein ABIB14_001150 [Arthrobacter sp. UYEF3]
MLDFTAFTLAVVCRQLSRQPARQREIVNTASIRGSVNFGYIANVRVVNHALLGDLRASSPIM